jgi:phosphoribosylaminoimidazole-succinocarboxamide synthase
MPINLTDFKFPKVSNFYRGKVRDVYYIGEDYLAMVITDRISSFDVVLPKPITHKGQILNDIAYTLMKQTEDIAPNWLISKPHANAVIGQRCEPYKVEMVVRGYLCGSAWRAYASGIRTICGVTLPDGLYENQPLKSPIITPTTKADEGHDMDISREEIIDQGIVPQDEYAQIEKYSLQVFQRGTEIASARGLILVDTKFEFGKNKNGQICLIDEILTPDSSRYFYAEGYKEKLEAGIPQRQLSKEFVREWLIANGFQGKEGQCIPTMTEEVIAGITMRYIELYETILGQSFIPARQDDLEIMLSEAIEKLV